MKTVFKCLIATTILALSLVFGLSVYAEEQITDDGLWSYALNGENAVLTAYHGSATDVYVPSRVYIDSKEYSVTKLGDGAFKDNDAINSVTLGDSIKEIGAEAFYDCDGLVCILTTENVVSIGDKAFYGCDIFNSIILYDSINSIGSEAFAYCPKLVVYCNEDTIGYAYVVENNIEYKILNPDAKPEIYTVDGLTYYISNGEASVLSCEASVANAVILSHINGYPVTFIEGEAFSNQSSIVSVSVPVGVKAIGEKAFEKCTSLSAVNLSEGLTRIGKNSFASCSSLKNIVIPSTVSDIGPYAFSSTKISDIILPDGLTEIAEGLFYLTTTLNNISIPESVTNIGNSAFMHCSLKQITIPANVKTIGEGAFYWNDNFTDIAFENGLETIGANAFNGCSKLENLTFSESIKTIGDNAFSDCQELINIVFAEGLETIGSKAFDSAFKLSVVAIPKSVTYIASDAFLPKTVFCVNKNSYAHSFALENDRLFHISDEDTPIPFYSKNGIQYYIQDEKAYVVSHDESLTSIIITDKIENYPVVAICDNVFRLRSGITSVSLPETLEFIGDSAFNGCSRLDSIIIPDSVTYIGEKAFHRCTSLNSITLSKKLTAIASNTFDSCSNLKSIVVPDSVSSIGERAFNQCSSLQTATIGTGIESIGDYAFFLCTSLESVNIPSTLLELGESAFNACSALKEISIPSLQTIPSAAFSGCTAMERVTIAEGVQKIEAAAFNGCSSLPTIDLPQSIITISKNAFTACDSLMYIVIPQSTTSIDIYAFDARTLIVAYRGSKAEAYVKNNPLMLPYIIVDDSDGLPEFHTENGINYLIFTNKAIAISSDSNLIEAVLPDRVKNTPITEMYGTFSGNGSLEKVALPSELVVIGGKTFYGCKALENIVFPESLKTVGEKAFYECVNLANVSINAGLEEIYDEAFSRCEKLTNISLPDTITELGHYAVAYTNITDITIPKNIKTVPHGLCYSCENLKTIKFHDGITYIEEQAFSRCTSLKEVVLPESVDLLGKMTFYKCSSLEKVQLPKTMKTIWSSAFGDCSKLKSIVIPSGLSNLDDALFSNCTALEYIEIPFGVELIGWRTFEGCDNLKTIIIPDSVKYIKREAFQDCINLKTLYIPQSVIKIENKNAFAKTVLIVHEDSFMLSYAKENVLPYFILKDTANPEIAYGTGIEGKVSYTDGSVASGVTVEILYDDGTVKESVKTDENGVYSFTYAEVGRYTVKATDAANLTASDTVSVKRMNVFDVFVTGETDLVLKNSWSVSGTVNTDGPADITLADTDGKIIAKTESTDGTFTFENVSNGSYIIKADTESASATVEVTVFNGNVSDIVIDFPVDALYATVKGYVEIEDRELEHHRRSWVDVTIYDSEGIAVGSTKTDDDGAYCFKNLSSDDYAIVAHTEENRPDKHKGHIRPHQLTGYAYVTVTEAVVYEVETIVLYEENEEKATLSGKVTANGEHQACEVILSDVFRHERARYETKKNGKYEFVNVNDGLYFVTAITESKGVGMTVVVVRYGRVYGDTDIRVYKHQHIHDRETKWHNDIPECHSREDAIRYRDRIAEEKRYFDGLPEKEKKQFSKEYRDMLNKYAEWIADYDFTCNDENVKVKNGGMMVSGDELEAEEKIEIVLNIEKTEGHTIGDDGIKDKDDYLQQSIENSAGKHHIAEYYDITLLKKNGKKDQTITCISRDTDTTGKIRITMDIPEKYRGHKHYSFVHMHNGEAVTLTDLDNDPNTVTFEIDRFSTFTLIYTDEDLIAPSDADERLPFVGAQIRTEGTQALRFVYSITKELYDTLEKPNSTDDTSLGFGAIIMPKRYMNEGDILEKGYTNTVDGKQYSAKTVPAVKLFGEDDTSVSYTVALTGIKEENYTEEYVTVSYATYLDENGEEITVYGDMTQNVTVFSVAELAYADENTSDTVKQYIYDNILSVVDPVKYPKE